MMARLGNDLIDWTSRARESRAHHVALATVQMSGAAVLIGLMFRALRAGGLVAAMLTPLPARKDAKRVCGSATLRVESGLGGPGCQAVFRTVSPSSSIIASRMMNFCGLPVAVTGNSATNFT